LNDRQLRRLSEARASGCCRSPLVIVGSLRGADGAREYLIESLKQCATSNDRVTIALEPLNRYESRLLNTVAETLEVVEAVGADNVGLLFDTFHANIEEADPAAAIGAAGSRLAHVHLADSNRWVPGYGHIDFHAAERALDRIGYGGAVVLEPLLRPRPDALLSVGGALRGSWAELPRGSTRP